MVLELKKFSVDLSSNKIINYGEACTFYIDISGGTQSYTYNIYESVQSDYSSNALAIYTISGSNL